MLENESFEQPTEPRFPSQKEALMVILVTILLTFVAATIGAMFVGKTELLLVEVVTIVPAVVYVFQKRYPVRQVFRLNIVNSRVMGISVLIGFSVTILVDELDRLVALLFPMPEVFLKMVEETMRARNAQDMTIILFTAVFLAAICEEMLFRGFLQNSMEKVYEVTKAILLSALIFAIIHFNPWWSIQFIVFGVILGVMAWKSQSIIPGAIVHGINNGLAIVFVNVNETSYDWYIWKNHVSPSLLLLAGVVAFYGFKLFYRFCEEE